jgi:sugar/nucleoside kinase (ribokinase family)
LRADIQGNTGAGDAAIAGFLASILTRSDPITALRMATAAGALSVEASNPFSKLTAWEKLHARLSDGWESLPLDLHPHGWHQDDIHGVWWK